LALSNIASRAARRFAERTAGGVIGAPVAPLVDAIGVAESNSEGE